MAISILIRIAKKANMLFVRTFRVFWRCVSRGYVHVPCLGILSYAVLALGRCPAFPTSIIFARRATRVRAMLVIRGYVTDAPFVTLMHQVY